VELKTRAYAQNPKDKQLTADLADSLSWLASAHMQQGKLVQAEALYARGLALLQTLHQAYPNEVSWVNELAATWSHQSDLKQARGQLSGAYDDARQAHALLQTIVERDQSNRNWQRNLYIAELRMFDTDTQPRPPAQAWARLEQLQTHFSELSKLEPKHLNLQTLVAKVRQRKAAMLLQQRQTSAAADELAPALEKLQQLHASAPSDQFILTALTEALLLKADLDNVLARTGAQSSCEAVRALLHPLISDSSDFHLLAPWVKAHTCMDQGEQVSHIKKQLESMPYRDPAYLQYLSNHQPKKANS
jgi:tetratricopeptide (TPR) repeat protein